MSALILTSSAAGEWPPGIHWAPGETRTIPEGWPLPGERPGWLFFAGGDVPQDVAVKAQSMVQRLPATLARRT